MNSQALKTRDYLIHRSCELYLRLNLQIPKFTHACIPCGRWSSDIPRLLDTLFHKASHRSCLILRGMLIPRAFTTLLDTAVVNETLIFQNVIIDEF